MPYNISTGSTSIQYGSSLKIGWRLYGSTSPFTYITHLPDYDELPYTFELPTVGTYEIEYTQVCPSCSAPQFSASAVTLVTVT